MARTNVQEAFNGYASAQAARGLHLLGLHRRDESESCRECGNPHPCATRRLAAELIIHFGHWSSPLLRTTESGRRPKTPLRRCVPASCPAS